MTEFISKNGTVYTEADFDRMVEEAERGEYPGVAGTWVVRPQGRPTESVEELVSVTVKVPRSQRDCMDKRAKALQQTRSQYMRDIISRDLIEA